MSSGQPRLHSEHLSKQKHKKPSGGIERDWPSRKSPVSLMSQGLRSLEPASSPWQPCCLQTYGVIGPGLRLGVHRAPGSILSTTNWVWGGAVIAAGGVSGGSGVQGQPLLCRKFQVCLGYMRPYL